MKQATMGLVIKNACGLRKFIPLDKIASITECKDGTFKVLLGIGNGVEEVEKKELYPYTYEQFLSQL